MPPSCRTCARPERWNQSLFRCTRCKFSYHSSCHDPKPDNGVEWVCVRCIQSNQTKRKAKHEAGSTISEESSHSAFSMFRKTSSPSYTTMSSRASSTQISDRESPVTRPGSSSTTQSRSFMGQQCIHERCSATSLTGRPFCTRHSDAEKKNGSSPVKSSAIFNATTAPSPNRAGQKHQQASSNPTKPANNSLKPSNESGRRDRDERGDKRQRRIEGSPSFASSHSSASKLFPTKNVARKTAARSFSTSVEDSITVASSSSVTSSSGINGKGAKSDIPPSRKERFANGVSEARHGSLTSQTLPHGINHTSSTSNGLKSSGGVSSPVLGDIFVLRPDKRTEWQPGARDDKRKSASAGAEGRSKQEAITDNQGNAKESARKVGSNQDTQKVQEKRDVETKKKQKHRSGNRGHQNGFASSSKDGPNPMAQLSHTHPREVIDLVSTDEDVANASAPVFNGTKPSVTFHKHSNHSVEAQRQDSTGLNKNKHRLKVSNEDTSGERSEKNERAELGSLNSGPAPSLEKAESSYIDAHPEKKNLEPTTKILDAAFQRKPKDVSRRSFNQTPKFDNQRQIGGSRPAQATIAGQRPMSTEPTNRQPANGLRLETRTLEDSAERDAPTPTHLANMGAGLSRQEDDIPGPTASDIFHGKDRISNSATAAAEPVDRPLVDLTSQFPPIGTTAGATTGAPTLPLQQLPTKQNNSTSRTQANNVVGQKHARDSLDAAPERPATQIHNREGLTKRIKKTEAQNSATSDAGSGSGSGRQSHSRSVSQVSTDSSARPRATNSLQNSIKLAFTDTKDIQTTRVPSNHFDVQLVHHQQPLISQPERPTFTQSTASSKSQDFPHVASQKLKSASHRTTSSQVQKASSLPIAASSVPQSRNVSTAESTDSSDSEAPLAAPEKRQDDITARHFKSLDMRQRYEYLAGKHDVKKFDEYIYSAANEAMRPAKAAFRLPDFLQPHRDPRNVVSATHFAHLDPRVHWTNPKPQAWYDCKQDELSFRGNRKSCFGVAAARHAQQKAENPKLVQELPERVRDNPKWLDAIKELDSMAAAYHEEQRMKFKLDAKGKDQTRADSAIEEHRDGDMDVKMADAPIRTPDPSPARIRPLMDEFSFINRRRRRS